MHIALANAHHCLDCDHIVDSSQCCTNCLSKALHPVAAWIDRPEPVTDKEWWVEQAHKSTVFLHKEDADKYADELRGRSIPFVVTETSTHYRPLGTACPYCDSPTCVLAKMLSPTPLSVTHVNCSCHSPSSVRQ